MCRNRPLIQLLLSAPLLLGLALPSRAVPFKGSKDITLLNTPPVLPCDCSNQASVSIVGELTILGKYNGVATVCFGEADPEGVTPIYGCFDWTSVNENRSVRGTFQAYLQPDGTVCETATITGGGGELEGTTGDYAGCGRLTSPTTMELHISGEISIPRRGK